MFVYIVFNAAKHNFFRHFIILTLFLIEDKSGDLSLLAGVGTQII